MKNKKSTTHKSIWQQIVEDKKAWIGGSFGEHDGLMGNAPEGIIGDIRLEKSKSDDDFHFVVDGAKNSKHSGFSCNITYWGFGGRERELEDDKLHIDALYVGGDSFRSVVDNFVVPVLSITGSFGV